MNSLWGTIIEVLGVTLPVFVVIAIGYFIRRKKIISEEHVPVLNKLTYNFGLSSLVFIQISKNKFSDIFNAGLIKVIFPSYFTYILIIFCAFFFTKIKIRTRSAIIVSSFRNNMAFIGMPVLLYAFGRLASAKASVVIAILLPLNFLLTAIFFQVFSIKKAGSGTGSSGLKTAGGDSSAVSSQAAISNETGKINAGKLLKEMLLDPVVIAVAAGILVSYFNIRLPKPVINIFDILSDIAVPLALISIGASFKFFHIRSNFKYITIVSTAKLIFFPLIAFLFGKYVFKLESLDLISTCILFATPVAVATYIQAQKYDADLDFISSAIITSTILSSLTMTGWLFLLKVL